MSKTTRRFSSQRLTTTTIRHSVFLNKPVHDVRDEDYYHFQTLRGLPCAWACCHWARVFRSRVRWAVLVTMTGNRLILIQILLQGVWHSFVGVLPTPYLFPSRSVRDPRQDFEVDCRRSERVQAQWGGHAREDVFAHSSAQEGKVVGFSLRQKVFTVCLRWESEPSTAQCGGGVLILKASVGRFDSINHNHLTLIFASLGCQSCKMSEAQIQNSSFPNLQNATVNSEHISTAGGNVNHVRVYHRYAPAEAPPCDVLPTVFCSSTYSIYSVMASTQPWHHTPSRAQLRLQLRQHSFLSPWYSIRGLWRAAQLD